MKKTLALLFAVVMLIGCMPFASAAEANYNYKISTEFYAEDANGDWAKAASVYAGEDVKMRVSISTNFVSGPATLLFAYDKDVLSVSGLSSTSSTPLTLNKNLALSKKIQQVSGAIGTTSANKQLGLGNITQQQFEAYRFIAATIRTNGCVVYDGSDWLFEIDMTVLRSGIGKNLECFIIPETICTVENSQGAVAFPYAESEDASLSDLVSAFLWYENTPELESEEAEITVSPADRSVTWNVDGVETVGYFEIGAPITGAPAPEKQGYIFAGWEPEVPDTMPDENITAYAKWEPADDTPYTHEIYEMDTNGEYLLISSVVLSGTTGGIVCDKTPVIGDGFEINQEKSVLSGVIAADGSLVLKTYFDRIKYTFTTVVDGVEASAEYYYGEEIPAPANPEKQGYVFAGWSEQLPAKMPAGDVTVTATWNASTDTPYAVETYEMDTNGEYVLAETDDLEGTTGETVTAEYTVSDGFIFNEEKSVLSGVVAADGSLVLRVYFDREKYTFTTVVDGVEASAEYYYGEEIPAPEVPEKQGYVFAGWSEQIPATMPAGDVTVSATWIEADDVAYTVETYMMNVNGEYDLVSTAAHKGSTGETVNESYSTFEGFVVNEEKSVLSGVISADGSLVLRIYVDRAKYTFTAVVDGVEASAEYYYGEEIPAPATPSKAGFVFTGWSEQIPATMPARNVTVTAKFSCAATVKIKNNPGSRTIKYGETLRLTAETANMPADAKIFWFVDGAKKGEGTTFDVSHSSGTVKVTVKIVDASGKDYGGSEISDSQNVSVNSGFFQKIISFFKNLFGMNRTVIQRIFK